MTTSLYDFTVPALARALTNLSNQLDKANTHAAAKKCDFKAFAEERLIADMLPLSAQVQVATDNAKGAVARLIGIEAPKYDDNDKTCEELKARITKTLDFLNSVRREQFAGAETREIVLTFPSATLKFTGQDYVTKFVLPNFYFHVAMAYALLRKNGVDIGKRDFLGAVQ